MLSLSDIQEIRGFRALDFIARQVVEGFVTGLHKSPFHGFSVEFAEHRLYNPGESTRNIDWRLLARTDKLFVKRYEEETNLRCQLLIDGSASMHFPDARHNKLIFSVYCAAALVELLKKQRDAFGLSVFSDQVQTHTQARSTAMHQKLVFFELEKLLASGEKDRKSFIADALHEIAEKIHKRSLVILFSDMLESSRRTDELFGALQHLKHNKHEVVLFHVTDKKYELEFGYENRPYLFRDMETGEQVKAFPHEVKEHYRHAVKAFRKELKLRCGQYGIDLIDADMNAPFDQVLHAYLIKRNRMSR